MKGEAMSDSDNTQRGDLAGVHICWSRVDREYRRVIFCPTCKCRRRFYVWSQDWYDPIATCCHCGDAWEGGYRMQRPFARGWRERAAAKAKRDYANVGSGRES